MTKRNLTLIILGIALPVSLVIGGVLFFHNNGKNADINSIANR